MPFRHHPDVLIPTASQAEPSYPKNNANATMSSASRMTSDEEQFLGVLERFKIDS
jgi:hypothetical protein